MLFKGVNDLQGPYILLFALDEDPLFDFSFRFIAFFSVNRLDDKLCPSNFMHREHSLDIDWIIVVTLKLFEILVLRQSCVETLQHECFV